MTPTYDEYVSSYRYEELAAELELWARERRGIAPRHDKTEAKKVAEQEALSMYVAVASHHNIATETQVLLAKYTDYQVRVALANNPSTHLAILMDLARDENFQVRRAVASNPNTTHNMLEDLLHTV